MLQCLGFELIVAQGELQLELLRYLCHVYALPDLGVLEGDGIGAVGVGSFRFGRNCQFICRLAVIFILIHDNLEFAKRSAINVKVDEADTILLGLFDEWAEAFGDHVENRYDDD